MEKSRREKKERRRRGRGGGEGEEEEREKKRRGRRGGEGEKEERWGGGGWLVGGHCVSTEQTLPHIYGNYTIVLAELAQLVAPGKPELEQKKEKL